MRIPTLISGLIATFALLPCQSFGAQQSDIQTKSDTSPVPLTLLTADGPPALRRRTLTGLQRQSSAHSTHGAQSTSSAQACAICYDDLGTAPNFPCPHCKHSFHLKCIQTVRKYSGSANRKCPLCRQLISYVPGDLTDDQRLRAQREREGRMHTDRLLALGRQHPQGVPPAFEAHHHHLPDSGLPDTMEARRHGHIADSARAVREAEADEELMPGLWRDVHQLVDELLYDDHHERVPNDLQHLLILWDHLVNFDRDQSMYLFRTTRDNHETLSRTNFGAGRPLAAYRKGVTDHEKFARLIRLRRQVAENILNHLEHIRGFRARHDFEQWLQVQRDHASRTAVDPAARRLAQAWRGREALVVLPTQLFDIGELKHRLDHFDPIHFYLAPRFRPLLQRLDPEAWVAIDRAQALGTSQRRTSRRRRRAETDLAAEEGNGADESAPPRRRGRPSRQRAENVPLADQGNNAPADPPATTDLQSSIQAQSGTLSGHHRSRPRTQGSETQRQRSYAGVNDALSSIFGPGSPSDSPSA